MRILLDTNIFILREDNKVISQELQYLLQILGKIKAETLIHPISLEELKGDKDESRMRIIFSKVGSYLLLESPPDLSKDDEFKKRVSEANDHDRIDNNLLYAVYKNAVDFLITEDSGIHKKAAEINIQDRVLLIDDALQRFKKGCYEFKTSVPPALKEDYVYNLDLNDPIFDRLKKNYPEFNEWFSKISRGKRKCWVHYNSDGKIGALLIFKIEDEPIEGDPPLPKKKRLKISTFIVTNVGQKIGELFIKLSIDFCVKNGLSEMYLTHFTEPNDMLVQLISEYGFRKVSVNPRNEEIYLKKMIADASCANTIAPLQIVNEFYPSFYDGEKVRKYIIPIQPQFHSRLFTDYPERQLRLAEQSGEFIVEGNTIKKAYLTNSSIKTIQAGDIVLFYRSRYKSEITSLGVVESVYPSLTNPDEIWKMVIKRTVYSREEIEKIAKKPTTVLLFYHICHLPNPVSYRTLKGIGALSGPPQSICKVDEHSYREIVRESNIDERFIIH